LKSYYVRALRTQMKNYGSVPFAHVAINHNHSQQPMPRGFPLFKRCEWLVVNCNVGKWAPFKNYVNVWPCTICPQSIIFSKHVDV